jgi:hypothetical protein
MSELPLVTVALITYQFERYIERAIDSAVAMDWPQDRLEVVVVDDGSTDRTPELVAAYGDRVRYLHKENEGVVATMSRAFELATGEFIAVLAGDDECMPNRLRRQVAALQARPQAGLVYGDMELIDADSNLIHPSFHEGIGMVPQHGRCLGPLLARNTVSGGACLLRASALDDILPMPAEAIWEDWWMALKVAEQGEIAYLPEPIYRYRHHGANMNLGAPPEKAIANARAELPFRRWTLSGEAVSLERVRHDDLVVAVLTFDGQVRQVARAAGEWLEDVVEVTAADRAAARRELEAGNALRALSFDPASAGARGVLGVLESDVAELQTRSTVTVVQAAALIADPSLYADYAAQVGPDDDATLVVYAPEAEPAEIQHQLLTAIPQLAADRAPDVLLHAAPRTWAVERALRDRAQRILGVAPGAPVALAA